MRPKKFLLPLIFLIAVTGCQPAGEGASESNPTPLPSPVGQMTEPAASDLTTIEPQKDSPQMTQTAPTSPFAGMEILVEKAREDLAQRLSIAITEIELIEAKAVVWPDASLGCPQAGVMYAQVLTEGFLIHLDANGQSYIYHTDSSMQIVFCENSELPAIPVAPGEVDDAQPWMPDEPVEPNPVAPSR